MKRHLRFCMITTFYPPYSFGGDAIHVYNLSNELARHGHQVEVIHCIDSYRLSVKGEPLNSYANHPNVKVHGLESRFGFLSPLATQQTGFPLFKSKKIQQVLEKGFDVINYHNISLVGGPKILKYGKGIKLYTINEYWLICPTHILFKYNREACVQPHCSLCTLTYKRPPQLWRYFGMIKNEIEYLDTLIAPSKFAKDIHESRGIDIPIVQIPNLVSITKNASKSLEKPVNKSQKKPYFLFVGRLEKLKGLQTIIPLFRRYLEAELLVAGKGTYEDELKKLAEEDRNIRFLGHLSHAKLDCLYRNAKAVILPSICYEVCPLVTIEAFRQKTPVIVRNLGGMPEAIKKSGGGFIYDTEEELLSAIKRLMTEPDLRDTLGKRGYETYLQEYNPETHMEHYFNLIRNIATKQDNKQLLKKLAEINVSST